MCLILARTFTFSFFRCSHCHILPVRPLCCKVLLDYIILKCARTMKLKPWTMIGRCTLARLRLPGNGYLGSCVLLSSVSAWVAKLVTPMHIIGWLVWGTDNNHEGKNNTSNRL